MSSTVNIPVRTITKAQFITEQVDSVFMAHYSKLPDINYVAYINTLDDIPTDALRKAFKEAAKMKYAATPIELRRLCGVTTKDLPKEKPEEISAECKVAIEAAKQPGITHWEQILDWCVTAECHIRLVLGKGWLIVLPASNSWGEPDNMGRVVVRTQGKEFIGYDAVRTALKHGALREGYGVMFITEPLGKCTWVPIKIEMNIAEMLENGYREELVIKHAYSGHYPNYEKASFIGSCHGIASAVPWHCSRNAIR